MFRACEVCARESPLQGQQAQGIARPQAGGYAHSHSLSHTVFTLKTCTDHWRLGEPAGNVFCLVRLMGSLSLRLRVGWLGETILFFMR